MTLSHRMSDHQSFNKWRELSILSIISVLLDIYILRNSINIGLVQSADWPIPTMNLRALSFYVFPAWSYQDMAPNGASVFLLSYGFIASITHSPALVQKLFYYLPWALSPFSAFILLKFLGLKKYYLIFFSILYQFGPWINGQFMDGEPVNIMLYLFIPLIIYVLLLYQERPRILFFWITITMGIPSFFTLEAPFFYVFIIFPMLIFFVSKRAFKVALKDFTAISLSFFTVILFNIYSIGSYITGFSETASRNNALIDSFTGFPPAVEAKFWMFLFLIISLFVLIFLYKLRNLEYKNLLVLLLLMSFFLFIIYPGLGLGLIGVFFLEHVPIFAPFINPNEFLLYVWLVLFLVTAYATCYFQAPENKWQKGSVIHKILIIKKKYMLVALSIAIAILLVGSASIEIQSFGSHDTGKYLLTDGTHFAETQVAVQYQELENFLNANNASFGLSYHTVIFPENPNYTLPYYIGQQMIPGYIGLFDKNASQTIINGINQNNSNFLMQESILGIKYMAVLNIPGSAWVGTHGSPQLSMWGSQYIFIGNYRIYLRDLENLSCLREVYTSNGLWVFENMYYISPIITAKSVFVNDIEKGDFNALYNITPTSGNLLGNTSYYYSGQNYTLNSVLNFTISKSKASVDAVTYLTLEPHTKYVFSFHFSTTGRLDTYYGSGQNAGMLFYNVTHTSTDILGGTMITISPESYANGTYSSTFSTPNFNKSLAAIVVFQLQPPTKQQAINVAIHNVTLNSIKQTNMFFTYFKQVNYSFNDSTSIILYNLPRNASISIDQSYAPGWYYYTPNISSLFLRENSLGLLSFNNEKNRMVEVSYEPQNRYTKLLNISFGSISLFFVLFALMLIIPNIRRIFRG